MTVRASDGAPRGPFRGRGTALAGVLGLRGEPGLAGADLTRINLYEAELQFTPLRAATSARADVALAELAGADLEDADVRAARGGPQVNGLDQARNRDRARLAAP